MSKKIERELNRALLEKKVANMSVRERDEYADKVLRQKSGKNSNPFRKLFDAQGFNEDGVYLGERPSQGAGLSDIFNRASSGEITYGSRKKYFKQLDDKIKNLRNELKINRETKNMGGLLENDETRIGYATGEDVVDPMKEAINNLMELGANEEDINNFKNKPKDSPEYRSSINKIEKATNVEPGSLDSEVSKLRPSKKEKMYTVEIDGKTYEYGFDEKPTDEALKKLSAKIRKQKQEGGSIDDQMMMVMTPPMESEMDSEMPMESDEDMEDGYTRFIMDEALSEEEEDMLMSKLEQDEELAMIFDKVIDVAQEFAGAGPVEGPGSGVSDSIPARLSDGEFVFTAKAVEEIGADNLMAMMKDAEMKADERQGLVTGGPVTDVEEERVVLEPEKAPMQQEVRVTKETTDSPAIVRDEEDLLGDEVKKSMLRQSRNI